jgi:iron complex outermembrane recepter protein
MQQQGIFQMRRSQLALSVALIMAFGAEMVAAQQAQPRHLARANNKIALKIVAQPVGSALDEFGRQSGLHVVRYAEIGQGLECPGVVGTYTADEALTKILLHTGLRYEFLDDQTVAILVVGPSAKDSPKNDSIAEQPGGSNSEASPVPPDHGIQDQTAESGAQSLEQVLITGTHIRGAAPVGSAVYVYGQDDIKKMGVGSTSEFLAQVPQNFVSNGPATFNSIGGNSQNAQAATSVNLRGVGTDGTLVLINGHRPAPSVVGNFFDVSTIPLSAIDRVEILPDSASAIYGSDAVAGVVNFILKEDYDGAETRVRNGWLADSGVKDFDVSQALGHSWTGGGALLSLDYGHRDPLLAADRSFAAALPAPYYLEPGKQNYSALFSGHQAANDWLKFHLDALYSNSNTTFVDTYLKKTTFVARLYQSESQLNAAAHADLPQDWAAELSVTHGSDQIREDYFQPNANSNAHYGGGVSTADLDFDGPVVALPGGAIKLAVGAGGRWESYNENNSTTNAQGIAPNIFSRSVYDTFAELNVPLVDAPNQVTAVRRLTLSLAERYEHYSDAGATGNPKVGLVWEPVAGLDLRGSYSTSFNTAKFSQTWISSNALLVQNATCPAGPCVIARELGDHQDYRPQTAKSLNAGFDLRPPQIAGLKVAADYYRIDYKDRLGNPPTPAIILANVGQFPQLVTAGPTVASIQALCLQAPQCVNLAGAFNHVNYLIDDRVTNLAETKTSGIDLDVEQNWKLGTGTWNTGVHWVHIFDFTSRLNVVSAPFKVVDRTGYPTATRLQGNLGFSGRVVSFNVRGNYVNSYVNDQVVPNQRVASWTTADIWVGLALEPWFGTVMSGANVSLAAQNILNKTPPYVKLSTYPLGFDPNNASPDGRVLSLELTKRW